MEFPLDPRLRLLSAAAWLVGVIAGATVVAALINPRYLFPLLSVALVFMVPTALALYASAGAAGRRALFALSNQERGTRPSDRQMRRYLGDPDPWSMFALYSLITSVIIAICAVVASIAMAGAQGSAGQIVLAIAAIIVFSAGSVASWVLLRRSSSRGRTAATKRDRTWPLPEDSELLSDLRSTGGDGGLSGPV